MSRRFAWRARIEHKSVATEEKWKTWSRWPGNRSAQDTFAEVRRLQDRAAESRQWYHRTTEFRLVVEPIEQPAENLDIFDDVPRA